MRSFLASSHTLSQVAVIERFLDPSVRMTELGHDRWLVEVGEH